MVYVDSDGVLSDFNGWVESIDPSAIGNEQAILRMMVEHAGSCFIDASPLPHTGFLFRELRTNPDWKVLTAVPRRERLEPYCTDRSADEIIEVLKANKIRWFRLRGIPESKVIIVEGSPEKAKYCKPNDVLYDDHHPNIVRWRANGGIGEHWKRKRMLGDSRRR